MPAESHEKEVCNVNREQHGTGKKKKQEYPEKWAYNTNHVWAQINPKNNTALIGITDYCAEQFSEIDSIDVPMEGDELEMDSLVIHVHDKNRIRHFHCPLTGRALEVNREVLDDSSQIYLDWQKAWLFKMEYDDPDELNQLMNGSQYIKYLDSL